MNLPKNSAGDNSYSIENNLNCLFLFSSVYGSIGGIQKYNQQLIQAWKRSFPQHRLYVFGFEDNKNQTIDSQTVVSVHGCSYKTRWLRKLEFCLNALRCVLFNRVDLILAGHIRYAFIFSLLSKLTRARYVIVIHGEEATQSKGYFARWGLRCADAIWSVSRFTANGCTQENGINVNKVVLIPNYADEEWYSPGPVAPEFKEKYLIKNQKILLTVSRLDSREKHKGIENTLMAISKIASRYPELIYFIVGSGDDLPRLLDVCRKLKVDHLVRFVGGCSEVELLDFYRSSHCYVMPSTEGFGIVYLEALLTGVPVVSGNQDGSEEPLQEGRLGWRVNKHSPEAIATACIEALVGADPRCKGSWLREETLKKFGKQAFEQKLRMNIRKLFA